MIADYNAGAHTTEVFFKELLEFIKKMEAEEARAGKAGLNYEELAFRRPPR